MVAKTGSGPWLTVVLWVAPIVFFSGGTIATLRSVDAAQAKTSAALEQHVREPGHAIDADRLRRLETTSAHTQEAVERLYRDVTAICVATGARCTH